MDNLTTQNIEELKNIKNKILKELELLNCKNEQDIYKTIHYLLSINSFYKTITEKDVFLTKNIDKISNLIEENYFLQFKY